MDEPRLPVSRVCPTWRQRRQLLERRDELNHSLTHFYVRQTADAGLHILPEMARLPIVADNGLAIGVVSSTRHPADDDWSVCRGQVIGNRPSDLLRENSMLDHVTIGVSPVRRA